MSASRDISLVLIPDYVSAGSLTGQITDAYLVGDVNRIPGELRTDRFMDVNDPAVRRSVMQMVPRVLRARIVTPSPAFYRRVAELRDDCFFADITARLLFSGAEVTIQSGMVREHIPQRMQTYLHQIGEDGAHIVYLPSQPAARSALTLITAAEVSACYRQGRRELEAAPGAIVTPYARDEAKELGVTILNDKGGFA